MEEYGTQQSVDFIQSVIRKQGAMGKPKDIQEAMKLTERELENLPGAPAVQRIDEATTLLTSACVPSVCVIDFFAARDWLQAGFEETGQKLKIHPEADNLAVYRLPSVGRTDRLEESLYWLLSASTIIYFLLGIIGG
jgi:hypothetical protein